jgi:hypothetical protein
LRADGLAHQHRARGPFAAEPETEQGTGDQQLIKILHKRAEQRERREPKYRQLQCFDAADPIGEIAAEPAPDRRSQQRHGTGQTRRAGIDLPQRDDGADHQRIDHEIHAIQRPARGAGPERPPLRQIHVAIKSKKAGILDWRDIRRLPAPDLAHAECFPGAFLTALGPTPQRLRAGRANPTPIPDAVISQNRKAPLEPRY